MIAAEDVAVLLLAAGASARFGARDKLAEPLDGIPLGLHAARTLAALPFAAKIAVTRVGGPDYGLQGFSCVNNPDPGAGQSRSIAIGVAAARRVEPRAILIALADMPRLSLAHVAALLACADERHPVVASTGGGAAGPPVMFASALFDGLERLQGDRGARALLRDAKLVTAPPAMLADVDTPNDLAAIALPDRLAGL